MDGLLAMALATANCRQQSQRQLRDLILQQDTASFGNLRVFPKMQVVAQQPSSVCPSLCLMSD